jgi:hypothetical protein
MAGNVDQRSFAIGDIITLESTNGTFLAADFYGTVYFDIAQGSQKTPEQFERSKWMVCSRLAYSDSELKKSLSSKRRMSIGDAEQKMIFDQAGKEMERNEGDMKKSKGTQLLYGQIIQLKHVATGMFLASRSSVAKVDKNCLALYLEKGASNAYFRISPRYKVRAEGGQILFNDEIVLGSVATAGFYVHESKIKPTPTFAAGAGGSVKFDVGSAIAAATGIGGSGPGTGAVSKFGYVYSEANLSRELTECGLSADICCRFTDEEECFLRTDSAIRFWLPDSEAFIQAPCVRTPSALAVSPARTQGQGGERQQQHSVVVGNRLPSALSPTHMTAFSAASAWALELVDRRKGALVEWNKQQYRLFHRASRKYLTVGKLGEWRCGTIREGYAWSCPTHKVSANSATNPGEVLDEEDIEVKFPLSLEEGRDDLPDQLERQTFMLDFVDRPSKHIPAEDVLVVIAHALPNGTRFYLHGDKDGGMEEDQNGMAMLVAVGGEGGEGAHVVVMSSVLRTYDAVVLMGVPDAYRDMIEFVTNALPVVVSHTQFIEKEGGSEGLLGDMYTRYVMLLLCSGMSIAFQMFFPLKCVVILLLTPAFRVYIRCDHHQS